MNVKKLEKCHNEMASNGYKWSNLNAPGTQTPLSHPISKLGEIPFLIIGPLRSCVFDEHSSAIRQRRKASNDQNENKPNNVIIYLFHFHKIHPYL